MWGVVLTCIASVWLSGCAMTHSGFIESLSFVDTQDSSSEPAKELKPHKDLPMTLSFVCPIRKESLMISPVAPLPPVIPVGGAFSAGHATLKVTVPEGFEWASISFDIKPVEGALVMPPNNPKHIKFSNRNSAKKGAYSVSYILAPPCKQLQNAVLEFKGFTHEGVEYPPFKAPLKFDSQYRFDVDYLGA